MPSNQAEAITAAITHVLNDSLENVSHSLVSKAEMQKVSYFAANCILWFPIWGSVLFSFVLLNFIVGFILELCILIWGILVLVFFKTEMTQESNLSKFKSEVQSSQVWIDCKQVLCDYVLIFEVYDFAAKR